MSVTNARRKLHSLARSGGNWRLKGMYLAELPKTEFTAQDVAKAWPVHKSDYRMLGGEYDDHQHYAPDRRLAFAEESEEFRELSDATQNGDWDSDGDGVKTIHADRLIKRALAFGSTTEEFNVLWRDQLFDTVIEGSKKKQIARDAANVINVETSTGNHPRGQNAAFARPVAEGGAIRDDREDMDGDVSWNTTKFGEGARATEELIDHSLIDLIERQVQWLGESCENALNRVWLTELVDNADSGNDVDTSTATDRDIGSVNAGITNIEMNDFEADTLVTHPRYRKTLFDSDNLVFSQRAGSDEAVRRRTYNPLYDLDMMPTSAGIYDPDGAETWDYDAAGEIGGVVYNRDLIGLYLYRDIEVKDYEDPIRDLQGVNARLSVDSAYHQPGSAARLVY